MVVGLGIDVIQNERIRDSVTRFGTRFINRIYTETEIAYCANCADPGIHYAARFAAKEAFLKALGTGWRGKVAWRDIEVVLNEQGAPSLNVIGAAKELLDETGATHLHVSISHTSDHAVAQVILEKS